MAARVSELVDPALPGEDMQAGQRSPDRFAMAHDASHYLEFPKLVATPHAADAVAALFRASRASADPLTFRSGGTSLPGQRVTSSILVDTRKHFQKVRVLDDGKRIRVEPGVTEPVMSRTTGREYRHMLEVLEEATR